MRWSIRHQLFRQLLLGILATSTVAGLLLYGYVRSEFLEQFDDALALKARSLASLIKRNPQGQIDLDFAAEVMSEFGAAHHSQFYEFWLPDGDVLARSPSLASHDLSRQTVLSHSPAFRNVPLPGGRAGRAIAVAVIPQLELDAPAGGIAASAPSAPSAPLQLILARDREELDESLTSLITALAIAAILMSAVVPILVLIVVRRGLVPLDKVARRANEIDATTLDLRFPTRDLPDEMLPICAKLNDLLDRLDAAFQRERQFTANAAHELRTPIAELRALAEVALRSRPETTHTAACFQDALDIALQMERLVTMLLALARAQTARDQTIHQTRDLAKLVAEAWEPLRRPAAQHGLRTDIHLPETAPVRCDPVMLSAILRNVLSNAVDHAPTGGEITCRLEPSSYATWILDVRNTNDSLTAADLPHLGEPFWRLATDRSDHTHAGLGLALICTYCASLGIDVCAELITPDCFRLALTIPQPTPHRE